MKKLIYLFIVAGILWSCQNGNKFTIHGVVAGDAFEGTSVYLEKTKDNGVEAIDSTVVQNGKFTFSGIADTAVLRFVTLDETVNPEQESRIPVLLEPGQLNVTFDTVVTVKGTKVNDGYNRLRLERSDLEKNMQEIQEQFNSERAAGTMTDERSDELRDSFNEFNKQLLTMDFEFVKDNIGNELGEYLFLGLVDMFEPEQQKEILDLAGDEFKANEKIRKVVAWLEKYEKVAVGKKFTDFTMKDPQGNEVSLSDYAGKGKYVLIDFWAAWCPPCRKEMPNVVAAYENYKSKGLEIVGVSIDRDHDEWINGLKEMNMTWPQMSDILYWNSPVLELYAINFIPHTVLLDKDGTIIDKNLTGKKLDAKLAELMP